MSYGKNASQVNRAAVRAANRRRVIWQTQRPPQPQWGRQGRPRESRKGREV